MTLTTDNNEVIGSLYLFRGRQDTSEGDGTQGREQAGSDKRMRPHVCRLQHLGEDKATRRASPRSHLVFMHRADAGLV